MIKYYRKAKNYFKITLKQSVSNNNMWTFILCSHRTLHHYESTNRTQFKLNQQLLQFSPVPQGIANGGVIQL